MKAARLIAVAVDENPELAGLARQVKTAPGALWRTYTSCAMRSDRWSCTKDVRRRPPKCW